MVKAKETLTSEFKGPNFSKFDSLVGSEFVQGNVLVPLSKNFKGYFYVFAPTAKTSVGYNFGQEATVRLGSFSSSTKSRLPFILIAPDPAAKDWLLVSKVWIGLAIQGKPLGVVQAEIQTLSMGSSPSTKQLTDAWAKIPTNVQIQVEDVLKTNRSLAAKFGDYSRFFIDGKGTVYEIPISDSIYQFENIYRQAFPTDRQFAE